MYNKRVSPMTGRNPIARAVAQKALRDAVLDQKIKLHFTDEDAPCTDFCAVIGMTLSIVVYASKLDKKVSPDEWRVKVVRGGLSACSQMADTDRFKRANIPAIEHALDSAAELNNLLSPDAMNTAFHAVTKHGFVL
jgi:hypothetical protein